MPESSDKKAFLILGAVGVGLYFLGHQANATGNNPSVPPAPVNPTLPPTPSTPTPLQSTQAQVTWIYNQLAQHGWASSPLWWSAAGPPTESPIDTTGANRNLVAKDQSVTDNYMQYFWSVNQFFGWNYPAGAGNSNAFANAALTGTNVWTPTANPTQWAAMQGQYTLLTQQLTPTFLT